MTGMTGVAGKGWERGQFMFCTEHLWKKSMKPNMDKRKQL